MTIMKYYVKGMERAMSFIQVRHNIEVAHRLIDMEGKCEAIHGHSMWVELKIHGLVDGNGTLDGLQFGYVKKLFRDYLDGTYDHHLLLNEKDVWAGLLAGKSVIEKYTNLNDTVHAVLEDPDMFETLPGLKVVDGDPTTENIARWIAKWANGTFQKNVDVTVHETAVNAAGVSIR